MSAEHTAEKAQVATERRDGLLHATCLVCGDVNHQPDKGLGRANIAAWRTRHQHSTPPDLPVHRTEAGYPNCSTCDGGGCLDCTDPA